MRRLTCPDCGGPMDRIGAVRSGRWVSFVGFDRLTALRAAEDALKRSGEKGPRMKRDNESTELNDNLFGLWERAHADAIERAPDGATWVVIGAIGSCTEMPSGPHPYPTHWHKPDREDDNAGWIPYRSRVYRCRLCRCEHTPSEEE